MSATCQSRLSIPFCFRSERAHLKLRLGQNTCACMHQVRKSGRKPVFRHGKAHRFTSLLLGVFRHIASSLKASSRADKTHVRTCIQYARMDESKSVFGIARHRDLRACYSCLLSHCSAQQKIEMADCVCHVHVGNGSRQDSDGTISACFFTVALQMSFSIHINYTSSYTTRHFFGLSVLLP